MDVWSSYSFYPHLVVLGEGCLPPMHPLTQQLSGILTEELPVIRFHSDQHEYFISIK